MRNAISAFFSMLRTVVLYEKLNTEIKFYRDSQNLSQKEYDDGQYAQLKEMYQKFDVSTNELIENYMNHAFNDLFIAFVENFSKPNDVFDRCFEIDEAKAILSKTYDVLIENMRQKTYDVIDEYTYFIDIVKEIISGMPEPENDEDTSVKCPYCDATPEIIDSAIFFGAESVGTNCEKLLVCGDCGAYAFMDSDGNVIGTLANKALHEKRTRVKSILSEYGNLTGSLLYETRLKFSALVGKKIKSKNDVEYFGEEECNLIIHRFLVAKKKIEETEKTLVYPLSHKDLMLFLENGGRIKILKELTAKNNGRLLIPYQVGNGVVTVKTQTGTEKFLFPAGMNYVFERNKLKIIHPSGNIDEYRLCHPTLRDVTL